VTGLPSVLSPADLPLAELQAARLDGELLPLAAGFGLVDAVDGPAHRTRAALAGRGRRFIAELDTAAWIWGAIELPPHPLDLCVDLAARSPLRFDADARLREVVIERDEWVDFGGVRATTPLRTAVDLARRGRPSPDVLRRLAAIGRFDADACGRALERRPNQPGKVAALALLQDVLTR
jgi:hypothetical protein